MAVYQCCPSKLNHCSVRNSSPHYLSEAKLSGFAALRVARGQSAIATERLARIHDALDVPPRVGPKAPIILRAQGGIRAISEALVRHAAYFDSEALR
jgi:hypothetical protein